MTGQNGAASPRVGSLPMTPVGHMDRLLTAEDVAALLQVKPSWVYAESRAGRLPTVPVGRYKRFRRSAVEAWICELEAGRR